MYCKNRLTPAGNLYTLYKVWVAILMCTAWPILAAPPVPLGLPEVPIPADNPQSPEKIALGKRLFEDARLSANGKVGCASCHKPELAMADGLPVAKGIDDQPGTRNTPSLQNVAYLTSLFWDGRRNTLEEQAADPFVNPVEHGLKDHASLLKTIRSDLNYREAFKRVFDVEASAIELADVLKAIASFERTLLSGNSAFDRYVYGKDLSALPPKAIQGMELFRGKAQCVQCHSIGDRSALFTDNQFHSLGLETSRVSPKLAGILRNLADTSPSALSRRITHEPDIAALGRYVVTRVPGDLFRFRTPSLRNVAITAPYMHDGSVVTLQDAVELEVYYRGFETGRPLVLTAVEKAALVAFLESLTGNE